MSAILPRDPLGPSTTWDPLGIPGCPCGPRTLRGSTGLPRAPQCALYSWRIHWVPEPRGIHGVPVGYLESNVVLVLTRDLEGSQGIYRPRRRLPRVPQCPLHSHGIHWAHMGSLERHVIPALTWDPQGLVASLNSYGIYSVPPCPPEINVADMGSTGSQGHMGSMGLM